MKPNDQNGKLPAAKRPFRVLVIAGSNRRQYNCPGEDLGNVYGRARIQSGNACVSTSMALCATPSPKESEGKRLRKGGPE
jgi:hypothetical protein